tara:strand:- start:88 stop:252 length:165 start_codon:yes stop_codon:yes gene_type:complete
MSKRSIEKAKDSKIAKKKSHTGNKGLTESLTNANVMVTHKVRKAQERRRGIENI